MYNDKVMDHFLNPRNAGEIENASGVGEVGNVKCGDIMRMYVMIENDVLTDVKFRTFGCGSAIAASSISTEMLIGKTVEEALEITNKDVVDELGGLPVVKVHCSVLAEQAFKMAIYDYAQKSGKTYKGLEGFDPDDLDDGHHH
jgi:nitrogen fixation NifU-like protein